MMRLPATRETTHPGEMLLLDFIEPHGLTQSEAARRLGISFPRLNEIIKAKRGITPDTALRLERLFGAGAAFWLNGQRDWDLWHAMHSDAAREIEQIQPLPPVDGSRAA